VRKRLTFRTFGTRIAVPAGFFALVSVAALSFLLIRALREQVFAEAVRGSESIADAIRLTVHHDMRINRRDGVQEIIQAFGGHAGVEEVRLFNKDGRISFSSSPNEVGRTVSRSAEPCVSCHSGPVPVKDLDPQDRSRMYRGANGQPLMATIRVIRNENGCQGSGCHATPQKQSVLGVLDVAMSLEPAEARIASLTRNAMLLSFGAVLLITGILFLMVWQSVRRPINLLVQATRRVARGDPTMPVPRGATDEIGILAKSFNEMVENLNSSRSQLEDWASTLEDKVVEKAEELREAQYQVVQAEKLSSVGLVAAGIAHELNSPLMAIITFTHLVRSKVGEDEQALEDLRMIEREANRCATIVRQLLDYSRKQSQEPETELTRIGPVIDGALKLLKIEARNSGIQVETVVPADLPYIDVNPSQLMQVFVNLIMNAVQAMPDGGVLHIESSVVDRAEYAKAGLPPHHSNTLVRTCVRDTGVGISPEALAKVFDPFFTTKPVGQGSGLGLSVSLGIVRGYRGTILVASDAVEGTEFTVLIPVAETPNEPETQ
jgi:two-component system, NtrC family, sensor kinase